MNSFEETEWFNQKIFTYKDIKFSTNNYIECGITINTKNYLSFSPVKLTISIFNQPDKYPKFASFNFTEISLIYNAVKDVFNQEKEDVDIWDGTYNIFRMNRSNKQIGIQFKKNKRKEKAVFLLIGESKENFYFIPLEVEVFKALFCLIKQILNNYVSISLNMTNVNLLSQIKIKNDELNNNIKTLPSHLIEVKKDLKEEVIVNNIKNKDDEAFDIKEEKVNNINNKNDKSIVNDFNEYFQIKEKELCSEIEEISNNTVSLNVVKKNVDLNSEFIDKVLKRDLTNLETLLDAVSISEKPIESFIKSVNLECNILNTFLDKFNSDEIKSLYFITKYIQRDVYHKRHKGGSISIVATKVDIYNSSEKYKNFVFDLITIFLYLKSYIGKTDSLVEKDDKNDKFLFYANFRSFLDPFIWGIIETVSLSRLESIVKLRFDSFKNIGLFEKYDSILKEYAINEITLEDIMDNFNSIKGLLENPPPDIKTAHKAFYKNGLVHVPYLNPYKINFLLNEVIPIEIAIKNGEKFKEMDDFKKFIEEPSDELREIFLGEGILISKKEKLTPFYRYIEYYQKEIPEEIRSSFLTKLKLIGREEINIEDFKLEDIGEHILKGIYIWNNNINQKYNEYYKNCENCLLKKEEILELYKDNKKNEELFNDEWFED